MPWFAVCAECMNNLRQHTAIEIFDKQVLYSERYNVSDGPPVQVVFIASVQIAGSGHMCKLQHA